MKSKSFGYKLWIYFILFSALILCVLWLMQTVFLQNFYNKMVINDIGKNIEKIISAQFDENITDFMDEIAYKNALLIFVTDADGTILYSGDEHTYRTDKRNVSRISGTNDNSNPYRSDIEMNWQKGASRNLPDGYQEFLEKLSDSNGSIEYITEDKDTFIFGASITFHDSPAILYISKTFGSVQGTIGVLRMQLIWVTVFSLLLGAAIAYLFSRRFAKPLKAIAEQAKQIGGSSNITGFEKGFCKEMDELSDILKQTSDNLIKAENYRRDLFANISHDLRTPLTMIKGYAEMVKDFSWENKYSRESDLDIIIKEADRLTELVGDILEYSAMQSGTLELQKEMVNISEIAAESIGQFASLCEKNGIKIDAEIEEKQIALCDRKSILRVMYNLIDNAISHTSKSKRICIRVSGSTGGVRFEVQDFGNGIAKEDLVHIWERYFTRKQKQRNGTGSGLGLAIAKEILSAHQAMYGVISEPEQGSIFWFEIGKGDVLVSDKL